MMHCLVMYVVMHVLVHLGHTNPARPTSLPSAPCGMHGNDALFGDVRSNACPRSLGSYKSSPSNKPTISPLWDACQFCGLCAGRQLLPCSASGLQMHTRLGRQPRKRRKQLRGLATLSRGCSCSACHALFRSHALYCSWLLMCLCVSLSCLSLRLSVQQKQRVVWKWIRTNDVVNYHKGIAVLAASMVGC